MRLLLLGSCLSVLAAIGLGACASPPGSSTSTRLGADLGSTSIGANSNGCVKSPHACNFPDATNTGVPAGMPLRSVPGQVSSGPGWRYNPLTREVDVTGADAVLSRLYIPYDVNITASEVTIKDDRIATAGFFAVSLRHTAGVVVENSNVSGTNVSTGRVGSAICDLYGDSTGVVIKNNNIAAFKTAVQISAGLIAGNYIHDAGYVAGDHTNGVLDIGTTQPLMIYHNTILNSRRQTDAISLDAAATGQSVANKTVEDNLLGGGSYAIYAGDTRRASNSNIVIEDNVFSQAYYPKGGQYGPVAYYNTRAAGNTWSGNVWDTTGQIVRVP